MHLTNWEARRSGAAMVVHGTDDRGQPVKLTGVDVIAAGINHLPDRPPAAERIVL